MLNLRDCALHYWLDGSGEPIFMIQGVGASGSAWRPQMREMAKSFTVAAYDNRGLGKSILTAGPVTIEAMAEDAARLMEHLGWKSAHVVGHSMGGLIAQQLALAHPEKVRSLSLLCTFATGAQATRMTPKIIWLGMHTRIGTAARRRRSMLRLIGSRKLWQGEGLEKIAAEYGELMGRDLADSPPIVMQQMRAMSRFNVLDRLGRIKAPTLVVSASEDPIALPKFGRQLAEAIPGAKFVELENASHAVTIEDPERINKMLTVFVSGAERAR